MSYLRAIWEENASDKTNPQLAACQSTKLTWQVIGITELETGDSKTLLHIQITWGSS